MFLLISGGHIGAPQRYTNTKLYKGAWNVSTYNSKTVDHKDLRFGKIVYIFVFHNISLSWLLPLESLYTDVYWIFLFVLFENIGELSERATTSAEREKNTTPLHWRSINTLRFIFWCEVYEMIHIWTAVVDESEEWSSQWIFQFKQLERRSLKKIRASTGFEPVTRDLLLPAPDGLWREYRGSVNRLPLDGFQYIFFVAWQWKRPIQCTQNLWMDLKQGSVYFSLSPKQGNKI